MKKYSFDLEAIKQMNKYGMIWIVAGIFEFMSDRIKQGDVILLTIRGKNTLRTVIRISTTDELNRLHSTFK